MHMTPLPRLKPDAGLGLVSNGNYCVALANQRAAIVIMSKFGRESLKVALKCSLGLLLASSQPQRFGSVVENVRVSKPDHFLRILPDKSPKYLL